MTPPDDRRTADRRAGERGFSDRRTADRRADDRRTGDRGTADRRAADPRVLDRPVVGRRTALRAAVGSAAVVALGAALAGDASRQDPGPSGEPLLATGEPTAFYPAFGRLLAAEIERAHPRLSCRLRTTAGSIANIELLRDGHADLALVRSLHG
ncbi:hypothetical protein GCM10010294_43830 [Streptomyces griseoloalbus]|uniref:hypothetical protein n=1 Tax=Streptomyces griseoloalbus TaxID=67303 RepID=UPI001875CFC5|nr:hypothetical protein GCM10010294_43830 [Streptomyces griseoloalbus]